MTTTLVDLIVFAVVVLQICTVVSFSRNQQYFESDNNQFDIRFQQFNELKFRFETPIWSDLDPYIQVHWTEFGLYLLKPLSELY